MRKMARVKSALGRGACMALLIALVVSWTDRATSSQAMALASPSVPVILYYTEGCHECQAVDQYLESLKGTYNLEIVARYEAVDAKAAAIRSRLDDAFGTPDDQRGVVPALFVGHSVLLRQTEIESKLEGILKTLSTADNDFLLKALEQARAAATTPSGDGTATFGVLTVLGAGLIDGVNPCAFATLVFFISYLIMRSRRKRDILVVGLTFGAGVFVAYLAAGLGLYRLVVQAKWFFAIAKWFYLAVGIFALGIAAFSLRDAVRVRHGNLEDMSLQLPSRQKSVIHRLIRQTANTGFLATSAFLVAFPVSLFEFLCTGQTYLPTIVFILSQNALRSRGVLLLVAYNVMFVVPLVVITIVAYLGVTSQRMVSWLEKHAVTVKLLATGLYVVLGLYLLERALSQFGILPSAWLH